MENRKEQVSDSIVVTKQFEKRVIEKIHNITPNSDRWDSLNILQKHSEDQKAIFNKSEQFQSVLDRHVGSISNGSDFIDLWLPYIQPMNPAPCHA